MVYLKCRLSNLIYNISNIRAQVFLWLWVTPQVISHHKWFWWQHKIRNISHFLNHTGNLSSHGWVMVAWIRDFFFLNIQFSENWKQTETYRVFYEVKISLPKSVSLKFVNITTIDEDGWIKSHCLSLSCISITLQRPFSWKVKGLPFFFSVQLATELLIPLLQLTNLLLLSLLCLLCLFPSWAQLH